MTLQSSWFQFTDGGSYVGEVDLARAATGLGVARGRTGTEFAGSWISGFEQTGVFSSSSGPLRYEGQWLDGKRNGSGVETRDGWTYRGEWINGFKGRYGVRQSLRSSARFEGTWASGLQDGYGVEKYADGGVYQGQWLNGLRHGYGVRQSATYAEAVRSHDQFRARLADHQLPSYSTGNFELHPVLGNRDQRIEVGGGFVLTEDVALDRSRRRFWTSVSKMGGSSTGSSRTFFGGIRKTGRRRSAEGVIDEGQTRGNSNQNIGVLGNKSSNQAPGDDDSWSICNRARVLEGELTENYCGEWKQDRRCGFGVCQRSDGLKYEGEWANNKKSGHGRTTLPDGSRLEGKYRNNVLVSTVSKSGRGMKFLSMSLTEKVENAAKEAQTAAENAKQKAELSSVRAVTAQEKAEESTAVALDAVRNAAMAQHKASELNQQDAQQGDNLKLHRIDEGSFLWDYDTASVAMTTTTTGATKKSKLSSSALQRQRQTIQDFDADNARRSAPSKWFSFPRRKPKIAEDSRTDRQHFESGNRQQLPLDSINTVRGVETGLEEHLSGLMASTSHLVSGGHGFELGRMKHQAVSQMHASPAQVDEKLIGEKIRRELFEAPEPKDAMHPRRNSLPSVIRHPILPATPHPPPSPPIPYPPPTHITPRKPGLGMQPTTRSPPPGISHTETYVIEKGIRKRVKYLYEDVEQVQRSPSGARQRAPSFMATGAMGKLIMSTMVTGFALSQSTPLRDWKSEDDRKNFRKMYVLESPSLRRKTKTGSTSDVSTIKLSEIMSREQAYVMSQRRREEMIVRRAEEERRRTGGEIVISVSGLMDCRVFCVFIVLISIASVVFILHRFGFFSTTFPH